MKRTTLFGNPSPLTSAEIADMKDADVMERKIARIERTIDELEKKKVKTRGDSRELEALRDDLAELM